MPTQTDAQIYLQSLRGHFQTEGYRSFRTFDFEEYRATDRGPFGALEVFNDETLMPECSNKLRIATGCQIILLPLVGAIEVEGKGREVKFVNSGEAMFFLANAGEIYTITNPYPDEAVNYLQIRIDDHQFLSTQAGSIAETHVPHITAQFDLSGSNVLLPIPGYDESAAHLFIGKYRGREEGVFINRNTAHSAFVFVIEGAFEVQNRLLEKRDGLTLRNVEEIEFEALSNDAIILIIDIGSQD